MSLKPQFLGAALAAMLHMGPAAALPVVDDGFVMITAPVQPVAGEPFTLVFAADALSGRDHDPSTGPVAIVEDNEIRIETNAECIESFCDVAQRVVFRVELPGLAAGSYRVRADFGADFMIEVVDGELAPTVRLAEGFWLDPRRPGSGLLLQQRGDTVGLAVLDHASVIDAGESLFDVEQRWLTDSPRLHGGTLVAAPFATVDITGQGCLGCEPYSQPEPALARTALRLTFESARRARAELVDGRSIPLVSLPFGAAYVPVVLTDSVDGQFGTTLPLPDLEGRWLFDIDGQAVLVAFDAVRVIADGPVLFPGIGGPAAPTLECFAAAEQVVGETAQRAGCEFDGAGLSPPVQAFARIGEITETRMRFDRLGTAGQVTGSFYATRLPGVD